MVPTLEGVRIWTSGTELEQCIDAPMHQIFLGLVKTIIFCVAKFLKTINRNAPFMKSIALRMNNVNQLRLSWCKVEQFSSDKNLTGGWLAENFLGYSRLFPIWYANLGIADQEILVATDHYARFIQSAYICICHLMTNQSIDPEIIDDHI